MHSSHLVVYIHCILLSLCLPAFQECSFQICLHFQSPSLWDFSCEISKGCLGARPCFIVNDKLPETSLHVSAHFVLMLSYVVSLSNLTRCFPTSRCSCRLAKGWYVFVHPSSRQEKYTLVSSTASGSSSIDCEVLG